MHQILAVDDDLQFLNSLSNLLKLKNYQITKLSNSFEVLKQIEKNHFDCLLLDIQMPGIDGFSLLQKIKEKEPDLPVIMISGKSTLNIATHVIRQGAFDFLEKGGDIDRLLITLKNAINQRRWLDERKLLVNEISKHYPLVGESKAMQEVLRKINTIAPTPTNVLITGESGTGKNLIARHIHFKSRHYAHPLIPLNCAMLNEQALEHIFETELITKESSASFNHHQLKIKGKTIFLDEISNLSPVLQDKLCQLLKNRITQANDTHFPLRIIAASKKDVQLLIKHGKFREDLINRLNGFHIRVPSLRERSEDIPLLAQHFVHNFAHEYHKAIFSLSQAAIKTLWQHTWRDNIRSLRKVMEKVVMLAQRNPVGEKEIELALHLHQQEEQSIRNFSNLNYF